MNIFNYLNKGKSIEIFKNKRRNYLIITQISNALIGIISGKLIAQFILPQDFGLYNLQFAAFTFFFSLLIGPTIVFIKSSYQNLIPQIGTKPFFLILTWLSIILGIVLIFFFKLYYQDVKLDLSFFFIIILLIPLNIINSLITDQFNVLDEMNLYSSFSIIKSIVGFCFLITFFYIFSNFLNGNLILWGVQISSAFVGGLYFISKYKFYISKQIIDYSLLLKTYLKFTGPLMFLALWSWINNYFDRYAIETFMTLKDVGIYNASYGLGSKFFLLISPIFMVLLTPHVYKDIDIQIKKDKINRFARNYFLLGVIILFFLFFITDSIGNFFLSKEYKDGFYIIFWIALVYLFMTGTYLFETIFYANHDTKVILNSNIISAILNIILNILIIPILGLAGAIVSMVFSTLIRFGFIYYKFSRL